MRIAPSPVLALLALSSSFAPLSGCEGARAEADGPDTVLPPPDAPEPPDPPAPAESDSDSDADEAAAAEATAPVQAALDGVRFDPATVRLPESSPEQQMMTAFDLGNTERARAIGEAALASADALSRGRLLWLLARTDASPDALPARLQPLADSAHPLARWAALRLAELALGREPARAARLAGGLTHGWSGMHRARLLLALARHKTGNDRSAEALLRGELERTSDRSPAVNIVFPLAEILVARGDRESLKEAVTLYRRVGARAALSETGERADKLAKDLLKRLRPRDRARLALPSTEDELARGETLMSNHRYEEARVLYDKLARRLRADKQGRCMAQLKAGRALFMQRDREQAQKRLSKVARRCSDHDVKAWAHYYAASALQRSGDPKGAIVEYEALVRDTPEHSLADDALYLEAAAQADAGDSDGQRKVLERMLSRYPKGDMRGEGRFALAFAARARGDYAEALAQLEQLIADGPLERNEGCEGRAAYWRARTLQDLGRLDEAKAAYVDLARALPLSYHAQQAMARLSKLDPKAASSLGAELAAGAEPETALTFAWRPELDAAAFKSAVELLRVGENDLAQQELAWLGTMGESADRDMLWLVASMLYEARAYADAAQLVRSRLRGFRKTPPRGRARLLWRIAYPRAFDPLIEQAAAESHVPADFVRAVAREESGFRPDAVSPALAYGLIQVIRPTARAHARALGLPSDPESLKRPDINLRIGSHFIHDLWQRYANNPAIVPAAYNAGFYATDRWLDSNGHESLDEWIERIPYRETRRYTRRVLQSYGIYTWLDSGRLPPLAGELPPGPGAARVAGAEPAQVPDEP